MDLKKHENSRKQNAGGRTVYTRHLWGFRPPPCPAPHRRPPGRGVMFRPEHGPRDAHHNAPRCNVVYFRDLYGIAKRVVGRGPFDLRRFALQHTLRRLGRPRGRITLQPVKSRPTVRITPAAAGAGCSVPFGSGVRGSASPCISVRRRAGRTPSTSTECVTVQAWGRAEEHHRKQLLIVGALIAWLVMGDERLN